MTVEIAERTVDAAAWRRSPRRKELVVYPVVYPTWRWRGEVRARAVVGAPPAPAPRPAGAFATPVP